MRSSGILAFVNFVVLAVTAVSLWGTNFQWLATTVLVCLILSIYEKMYRIYLLVKICMKLEKEPKEK